MTSRVVRFWWSGTVRRLAGVAISVAFVVLTLARVDIADAAAAISRISLLGLSAAFALCALEVAIRAERWRRVLQPFAPVRYRSALAYLCIGYFGNTLLPARLGDLARALLASRAFGVPRLRILTTILLERAADGLLILALVVVLAVHLGGMDSILESARLVWLIGAVGVIGLGATLLAMSHPRVATTRLAVVLRSIVADLAHGLEGVRSSLRLGVFLFLTVGAFFVATIAFLIVAAALGVGLSFEQAMLVMGALALSTAIPAAPGSIGTYEFVGLTTLTLLGVPAGPAFAIIVVVHLVATLPPALVGLALAAILHLRIADAARPGEVVTAVSGSTAVVVPGPLPSSAEAVLIDPVLTEAATGQ